jgi:hypothetical protein
MGDDTPTTHVFFGIRGKRVEVKFDRSHLRLGTIVYVTFSPEGEPLDFSMQPSQAGVPCGVNWIAPSEWYVELIEKFELPPGFALQVTRAVGEFISETDINIVLDILAGQMRLAHLYKTNEFEKNPLSIIRTVADRLDLCTRLSEWPVQQALFGHHRALVIYLLLTCFDRLGQPAEWLHFGAWLQSGKHAGERAAIEAQISENSNPTDVAALMYTAYQQRYGVKQAFFRFVNEVLPAAARAELLASIHIHNLNNPPALGDRPYGDAAKKTAFLFQIRNDYTHRGHYVPAVGESYFPEVQEGSLGYVQEVQADFWTSVYTHRWPGSLDRAVRIGLVTYLRAILHQNT